MFVSSVLDSAAIDEKQVASFFSKLTLQKLLYAAVLLVLCAVLIRLILKAADKLFSHSKLDHTIFGFLRTTAKAVLIFIAVMLVAGTLGIDTSSLLAILSVAGLAVSLSMQTALSNVAGALMILTAKPFRSGDYVQIGDKAGTVLTIGAVYTSLRTYDNQIIYLPNSQITTGSIVNMTSEDVRRIDVNVSASYDDAADKVRAVEGKIGRRVKRGPQLQPREQVQQELQPLGADRKLGAEIDSAAPFERKIELLDVETECHSHRRMAIRKKFLNSRNNTRGDIADMTMPSRSMVSTSSMRRRLSRAARTTNSVSNRKSEMRVRSITARARGERPFRPPCVSVWRMLRKMRLSSFDP